MDQLKTAFAQVKKYHFWILCGVIALVTVGAWYMATGGLAEERDQNKASIDGGLAAVKDVLGRTNPPNQNVHEGMETRIKDLQQYVMANWQEQYDRQKDAIFIWPSELTPAFRSVVEPLRPIEATPTDKEVISRDLRSEYANYIENELPKLAEVIGADWKATAASAGGGYGMSGYTDTTMGSEEMYSGFGAEGYGASGYGAEGYGAEGYGAAGYGAAGYGGQQIAPAKQFVVDWNTSNQSQLMSRFNWTAQGVPTTLQVLYAQEDLWVLKALMEIIKNTNDGATERHKAYVKKIDSIQIGRDASGRTGQVTPVGGGGGMGGMGMGMGSMMMGSMGYGSENYSEADMAMMSGTETETASTTSATPSSESGGYVDAGYGSGMGMGMGGPYMGDPAEGRYVDKDYKPLTAATLRSDVTADATQVYLAVAKRMPVRIVCQMDQRKIHKLLAECGNSPLTVEVRQVRIGGNAGKGGAGGGYGGSMGMSGMGMSGMSMDSGYGGSMGMGYGSEMMSGYSGDPYSGYGGSTSAAAAANQAANDVMVEIYGIVYIFNPVNKKALGIEETEASSAGQTDALTADAGAANNPS